MLGSAQRSCGLAMGGPRHDGHSWCETKWQKTDNRVTSSRREIYSIPSKATLHPEVWGHIIISFMTYGESRWEAFM